jgi:hypothetical protein
MNRRHCLSLMGMVFPAAAWAHHGWSSFDQDRPIYLEGKVLKSKWQNPHAQLMLELTPGLSLPADLAQRVVPAQSAPVDSKAVLGKAALPTRKDRQWEIELAPISRMEAWKVAEIKTGDSVAIVGFTFRQEKGQAIARCEYLFAAGNVYGLRSGPA